MNEYLIGIETSCDDTSLAVIDNNANVVFDLVSSQIKSHIPYGGVVPEIASREHIRNLPILFDELIKKIGLKNVTGIAATHGPGLLGSLLVGFSFAKALAYSLNVPFYGVNHIEAHITSPWIESRELPLPSLVLVVSGGHSHLFYLNDFEKPYLVSATLDDAAGEAFDKIGKRLKMPYPQGPKIDKLARRGNPYKFKFPVPKIKGGKDYSFSGLKTAFLFTLDKLGLSLDKFDEENLPQWVYDILASFEKSIVDHLLDRMEKMLKKLKPASMAIAGGVASNSLLRFRFKELAEKFSLPYSIPSPKYCTDNAVMVCFNAYKRWRNKEESEILSDTFSNCEWERWSDEEL